MRKPLLYFFLFLVLVSLSSAYNYCNETHQVVYANLNTTSSDHNISIVRVCTNETVRTDTTAAISITWFILLINLAFFYLATRKLSEHKYMNFIIKRCCVIIGIYVLVLNSAIMATIAAYAGIPVTRELFLYMEYFGWTGHVAIIAVLFLSIVQMFKEYKMDKQESRVGFK